MKGSKTGGKKNSLVEMAHEQLKADEEENAKKMAEENKEPEKKKKETIELLGDSAEEEGYNNSDHESSSNNLARGSDFGSEKSTIKSSNSSTSFRQPSIIHNRSNKNTKNNFRSNSMGSTTSASSNSRSTSGGSKSSSSKSYTNEITSKFQNQTAINITKIVEKISFSFDKVVR